VSTPVPRPQFPLHGHLPAARLTAQIPALA